ncbi:glutathione S-transferase C-terminal domain-containing protein homolog [Amyelois transitella]|uniref:glutathione S-transferase C-terminal domain-containing protein homolog n=1 Tax=Amyelois transitella TaxID=680683 RepID=UPI00298FF9FE|nr:glutathione S-transferase C-terminal domain-containing protein homolog [Amyelois transitella]
MMNTVYLEVYSTVSRDHDTEPQQIMLPLESFITYFIYKFASPENLKLNFVQVTNRNDNKNIILSDENVSILSVEEIPWQVSACVFPVVLYGDMVITGLCAAARHICKHRGSDRSPYEHEEGLLGFRKSCLQAPNEVSIWTKFCEVDIIKTVKDLLSVEIMDTVPKNLIRFENHLSKPVRVHNVYKIARDMKKKKLEDADHQNNSKKVKEGSEEKNRVSKTRKWKSNVTKELEINCSTKISDLGITHQFAEGPFFKLADLILAPSYYIIIKLFGPQFESLLPLTAAWYNNILNIPEINNLVPLFTKINNLNSLTILDNVIKPETEDVSLYKCDPKRHNPKKRLFTKTEDVENALSALLDGMELDVKSNSFVSEINWKDIPDGANPTAGHLPDERVIRKSQQLENLALAILEIAKDGDIIVDFCSGSGHLGILVAHLLPKCTIILLENKEQSLLRARSRVHEMGLHNVLFFQGNLDFFVGKFDIGIALHACGIASDLVLDKCLKANAKFVLCPCCYGSLHATDRLVYPRSSKFSTISLEKYLCIGHAADQTHEDHPLTVRGARCMAIIDSDRAGLAKEFGYNVTLSRLKPLSCTPKNNLLIGVPSITNKSMNR